MINSRNLLAASISSALFCALVFSSSVQAQSTIPAAANATGTGTPAARVQTQAVGNTGQQSASHQKHAKTKRTVHNLQGVVVKGIIAASKHSIQIKRDASDIQDSITAVNIGQLPDITIANSLERIPGVQVTQTAGEGTTVNINGLPEVQTLLNGGAYLSANNIDSIQPDYGSLPSSLFAGADVEKSAIASRPVDGISGTINLRTRRPWDLPFGWTASATAEAARGSATKKTEPDASALFGYNAEGRWGALLDISYSDLVHSFGRQGWSGNGVIGGENSSSAQVTNLGFAQSWPFSSIPAQVHRFANGSVDVNGDGKSNGAFFIPLRTQTVKQTFQPKRLGIDASFQTAIGSAFTLTFDTFYTHQTESELTSGVELETIPLTALTILPTVTHATGVILHNRFNTPGVQSGNWNQQFFTAEAYNFYGDVDPQVDSTYITSTSRNFNLQLKFNNGGPFTAQLRLLSATAAKREDAASTELTVNTGNGWQEGRAAPGTTLPPALFPVPPNVSASGLAPFNPDGIPADTYPINVNWTGQNIAFTFPAGIASRMKNENTYRLKSIFGLSGFKGHSGMNIVRLDGRYRFSDSLNVQFGLRSSIRSAYRNSYGYSTPVLSGVGGAGKPDLSSCRAHYVNFDLVMNGGGLKTSCTAGNKFGFYGGFPSAPLPLSKLPTLLSSNVVPMVNPAGSTGVHMLNLNPQIMKRPLRFMQELRPGTKRNFDPPASWKVLLKERSIFGQLNFSGTLGGFPVRGNFGIRLVRTNLGVTQYIAGKPVTFTIYPPASGITVTHRQYTDILPAMNMTISLTPKLMWRLAASKNMMPLTLDEWGGGFSPNYGLLLTPSGTTIQAVLSANSGGNPNLKPWRSQNYGTSLEYYISPNSMASVSVFYIKVASFIENGGRQACDIPDEDGVVRRCVNVSGPIQGSGASLHGAEAQYRQAFTFLPGILSHTGFDINGTYAPSSTGKRDLAGNPIPFPSNSKESGNLTLWYEDRKLQLRVGINARSKRAISSDNFSIHGLEEYEAPTVFIDASVKYQINSHVQVFLQGQNLGNERQKFYMVWPDQKYSMNVSERYIFLGAHVNF